VKYRILKHPEYDEWFKKEPIKSKVQIEKRLNKIENEGYFGHIKDLDEDLFEIKFSDGRRIYYIYIQDKNILLLIGGNKNGQSQDINKARNIYTKIITNAKNRKK
jgi:putative addiction module killer protein